MSEITKLYENTGIELIESLEWVCQNPDHCVYRILGIVPENCTGCQYFERQMNYPPFTAEKQLELMIFIINKFGTLTFFDYEEFTKEVMAEKIAKLLNNRWQNLSDTLKQQIKEVLE